MNTRFKEGDFVKFVGEDGCDATFGCNAEMEDTLGGKIFVVIDTEDIGGDEQKVYIAICDKTEEPDVCSMDWDFSSPMFELVEAAPEPQRMSFDDFCQEAQNA